MAERRYEIKCAVMKSDIMEQNVTSENIFFNKNSHDEIKMRPNCYENKSDEKKNKQI